ncbi:hypothetical protein B0H13DRAFT_2403952 [Mycena leptocephala]|nr:hypothetical protein B0H13DRAFT_2403952 [Mycena leptocephala]
MGWEAALSNREAGAAHSKEARGASNVHRLTNIGNLRFRHQHHLSPDLQRCEESVRATQGCNGEREWRKRGGLQMSAGYTDTSAASLRYVPPRMFQRAERLSARQQGPLVLEAYDLDQGELEGWREDLDSEGCNAERRPSCVRVSDGSCLLSGLISHRLMHVDPCTLRQPALVPFASHTPSSSPTGPHSLRSKTQMRRGNAETRLQRPSCGSSTGVDVGSGTQCHAGNLVRLQDSRMRSHVLCAYPSGERAVFPSPLPAPDMEIQVDSGMASTRSLCDSCACAPRTRDTTHSPVRYWPPLDLAIAGGCKQSQAESAAIITLSQSRLVSRAISIAPHRYPARVLVHANAYLDLSSLCLRGEYAPASAQCRYILLMLSIGSSRLTL